MGENIILKAENIVKNFNEPESFQVLKGLNFEVKQGEFLSLIGKSGCGKSTLLYILSTMDTDYLGNLTINNIVLTGKKQIELANFRNEHIGFVFQFHFLLPDFSVLENVMIPALKLKKKSYEEIKEKAYQHLKTLGLEEFALKNSNKLSGGQQQRVAIARALINDPLIIMGDEPTGNLDSKNAQIVFDIFKKITTEKKQSIITVTHNEDFATHCDRVIEMKDGVIIK